MQAKTFNKGHFEIRSLIFPRIDGNRTDLLCRLSILHWSRRAKTCLQACSICAYSSFCACAKLCFRSIQWFCSRTVKALIRLRKCAVWSEPSLSACARRHVFAAHLSNLRIFVKKANDITTVVYECQSYYRSRSFSSYNCRFIFLVRYQGSWSYAGWSGPSLSAYARYIALPKDQIYFWVDFFTVEPQYTNAKFP